MKRIIHEFSLRLVKMLNVALMTLPFAVAWYAYYALRVVVPYYRRGHWLVLLLFVAAYFVFARVYDAFLISHKRISEMIYSQLLAALLADAGMYVVICLLTFGFSSVLPLLACAGAQLVLTTVWSLLSHLWYFYVFPPKETLVIYDARENLDQVINDYGLQKKFHVFETRRVEECLQEPSLLDRAEVVFFSGVHSHDRNLLLKYCIERDIVSYVIPRVGDLFMNGAKKMIMCHLPLWRITRFTPDPEYFVLKRLFDIVVSSAALIVLSPLLLLVALAIFLCDRGPVFYRQTRLTKDGREFRLLKFRSMKVNAEADGVARLSSGKKDPRVTPVGRVIRACRIDELPQLLNVIGGSMSLVGPRPERPEITRQYEEAMPEFRLRLQVKAGLTGYAQVYGQYNSSPYDKLQMDLMYISQASLREDLRICFATVKILFMGESTAGVEEGQTTALKGKEGDK